MIETLGIIGSGQVGGAVARLAAAAGWHVVLSGSRGPQALDGLVAELGPRARAATPAEAATAGEVVVVATPLLALGRLPREALAGKVVLDAMNYSPERDGRMDELESDQLTSSELVQRHLAGAAVVKVFNSITPQHLLALARPASAADRSALPIAGDDAAAKERAAAVVDGLGYDAVDVGDLAQSWRQGPNTPLYALVYGGAVPEGLSGLELYTWFLGTPGAPVPAGRVEQLARHAVRGPAALALG